MIPTLYVFAGLPGTGKSTLAQAIAGRLGAAYLRIDTIEQALRDLCAVNVEGEGYGLAYRIAADNLRVGTSVVADSCNPIELTRDEWQQTALDAGAHWIDIEVVCSDVAEHRERVETRRSSIAGLVLPTWADVENREYHPWSRSPRARPRIVIDTAGRAPAACVTDLLASVTGFTST